MSESEPGQLAGVSANQAAAAGAIAAPGPDRTGPSQIIYWAHGFPAAALAGAIASFGMMFVGLFGLWMLAAGFLSVLFYRRRTRGGLLFPRAGARLGATTGLLACAMFAFVTVPTGLFRNVMFELLKRYAAQSSDPEVRTLTEHWQEMLKTPGGLSAWLVGFCLFLILVSAVGGALGGAFLSRRGRRPRPFS